MEGANMKNVKRSHSAALLGRVGGKTRAGRMTATQRTESARKAAGARWEGEIWERLMHEVIRDAGDGSLDVKRARVIRNMGRNYVKLGRLALEANRLGVQDPFWSGVVVTAEQVDRWKKILARLSAMLKENEE
jgi:hypothetical protein